ncbi:MAG TPA: type II toxin-antitoxin system VapC family toxin [Anaerolineales bacterium]|jgi:predicted nucleic acid-binding protein|nr:type II toxin-antitoxin system VapC family toxin [Anaerolineales bacterium]
MSNSSIRFVVDASVGIKLFVEEEFSEQAYALFSHLAADPPAELYIPDLFYIECANILLKYTRRFGRSLEDSQDDIADVRLLSLRSTSTADLMEEALLLAAEKHLSADDACYAVLALKLDIPLVTADEQLSKAISAALFLGNLKLLPFEE